MNTAYLLTGGNMGDRAFHLQQAEKYIQQYCGEIVCSSSIYETAAWGLTDQPAFYNQAIKLQTTLLPDQLMRKLLEIELEMGRIRIQKMGPRVIDLDILLIDDLVIETDLLSVPHPALPARRFALMPLAEIAPQLVHPIEGKTISALLDACTDLLNVQKK
jgi:2-amino-4-hydroxy-6-hydroxymethyldihydropteridine diphosphokinase